MATQIEYLDDIPAQQNSAATNVEYLDDIGAQSPTSQVNGGSNFLPFQAQNNSTIMNALPPGTTPPTVGQALQAGLVGLGQGFQNYLKAPIGAIPIGLVGPTAQQDITNNARNFISPAANFDINKAYGINPTPIQSNIENAVKNTFPIAQVILGYGFGSVPTPAELPEEIKDISKMSIPEIQQEIQSVSNLSPSEIIDRYGSIPNFINRNALLRKAVSTNNYQGALGTYGSQVPDSVNDLMSDGTVQYQTAKPFPGQGMGDPMDNWDQLPEAAKQIRILQGYVKPVSASNSNPIQAIVNDHFENPDDASNFYDLLKKNVSSSVFKAASKDPSIQNLHELGQAAGESSGSANNTFGQNQDLSDFENMIKQKYIIPHLQTQDALNGTNTAEGYANADNYFKNEVAPFRATSTLNSIALGLQNTSRNVTPASNQEILNEINNGRTTPSKYNFDPVTGENMSQIPQGHFLYNIQTPLKQMVNHDQMVNFVTRNALRGLAQGAGATALAGLGYLFGTRKNNL